MRPATKIKGCILLLLCCCAALFLCGCGGLTKGKAASEKAIAHFHDLYNEGKFDEIWKEAHAKFRSASKKEKYDQFMEAVQRKLGKVTSASNARWQIMSRNLTTTVVMKQKTVFEKGEGTETFTFQMDGEKAVLIGYHVESMDLITK